MRMGIAFSCLVLMTTLASAQKNPGSSSDFAAFVPRWARPGQCGVNCLYAFLNLSGQRVSYDEVADSVPVQPKLGSSLSDLADAAQRFGAEVELLKVQADDLKDLTLPYIAHLDLLDTAGTGHFITVYTIETDGVTVRYIDGASGLASTQHIKDLKHVFTGYVLANKPRKVSRVVAAGAGLTGGLVFVVLVLGLKKLMASSEKRSL